MTQSDSTFTTSNVFLDFAKRLKEAREERAFTQNAVALRTKWHDPDKKGVSRTAIIGYEQGTSRPSVREIRLLCDVLLVSPNWLIYGTESANALPSLELIRITEASARYAIPAIFQCAAVLSALKGHERDAIQSLIFSLAGRQLGDMGVTSLATMSSIMSKSFLETLIKDYSPELNESSTLEEIAACLSNQVGSNVGNRFRFDEEANTLNPDIATYPPPQAKKS